MQLVSCLDFYFQVGGWYSTINHCYESHYIHNDRFTVLVIYNPFVNTLMLKPATVRG